MKSKEQSSLIDRYPIEITKMGENMVKVRVLRNEEEAVVMGVFNLSNPELLESLRSLMADNLADEFANEDEKEVMNFMMNMVMQASFVFKDIK